MKILKINYNSKDNFCELEHTYNARFITFIQMGIKPLSFRKYNEKKKYWSVHIDKILEIVIAGYRYFDYINYASLPENIQIEIIKVLKETNKAKINYKSNFLTNPYSLLFVTENAPIEVIKAAYKALARIHHPDVGGDIEKFKEIQRAFSELLKLA